MELIRIIREKSQAKKQAEIARQAKDIVTLRDFENGLYIAYNGTPLAPIDPSWTTKEIVQQLSVFRNNFISSRLKEAGLRIAASL
jgi:hypothetical protein